MSAESQGDIDAVVDEEKSTTFQRDAPKLPGQLKEFTPRKVLFTELDCIDTTVDRRSDRGGERHGAGASVGDQAETEPVQDPMTPSSGLDAVA